MFGIWLVLFFINGVVINIKIVRELPTRVDLLIFELVVVEADSLHVDNQVVG